MLRVGRAGVDRAGLRPQPRRPRCRPAGGATAPAAGGRRIVNLGLEPLAPEREPQRLRRPFTAVGDREPSFGPALAETRRERGCGSGRRKDSFEASRTRQRAHERPPGAARPRPRPRLEVPRSRPACGAASRTRDPPREEDQADADPDGHLDELEHDRVREPGRVGNPVLDERQGNGRLEQAEVPRPQRENRRDVHQQQHEPRRRKRGVDAEGAHRHVDGEELDTQPAV